MKNIFVGNLGVGVLEDSVRSLFQAHGSVGRVNIVSNHETGHNRGYGFVEMPNDAERMAAIGAVNGMELVGRTLHVSQTSPKPNRRVEVTKLDGLVLSVCGSRMRVVIRGCDDALQLRGRDGQWFAEDGVNVDITFLSPFSNNGFNGVSIGVAANGHAPHPGLADDIPDEGHKQCSDCKRTPANCRLCLEVLAGKASPEELVARTV
jgi:RNA recognition motif-containing protein